MSNRSRKYTVRERLQGSGAPSWGDQFAASKKYVATLTPAQRVHAVRNMIVNSTRPTSDRLRREETEAYLKGSALSSGYSEADYEQAVLELLDEGVILPTIIDGREHGFVAALYGTGKRGRRG